MLVQHLSEFNLEQALFEVNEDYEIKVAETLDEAYKLLEVGFEYVTDMEGKKTVQEAKMTFALIQSIEKLLGLFILHFFVFVILNRSFNMSFVFVNKT